jgi:tRNA pseudouridine55 synthase
MLGILVVHKPQGITSHDVVNAARRKLQTKRVGHAGTLDPMATGVLVMAVGPATRFLQYLPLEPKVYEGTIRFGLETNTQDADGEVVTEREVPSNLDERILAIAEKFVGEIEQLPPMFSAVKKAGQPLYKYARRGEEVERQLRTVYIEELSVDPAIDGVVKVRVECSGGTYVRTLAHDIGQQVGCGAHLASLIRTQVGTFNLSHAVGLDEISPERLVPLKEALGDMPMVPLNEGQMARVWDGQWVVAPNGVRDGLVALLNPEGDVCAAGRATLDGRIQPECVIPRHLSHDPV